MSGTWRIWIILLVALSATGCASDKMMTLTAPPAAVTAPPSDQTTMVVFRSSFFGGAVQSSVFDVTTGTPELVGIVSAGKKIAYVMPAGKRRLMAIGENASFLDVNGAAGKTYYARVSPRFGLLKARFELEPVPASEDGLKGELAGCEWVENTDASKAWAKNGIHNIVERMNEYLPDWEKQEKKAMLAAEDGK